MHGKTFLAAGCLALVALCTAVAPVNAGGDWAYEDSYGNLVIHSPSGFKRILVGKGHLASAERPPRRVYLEERGGEIYLHERGACLYGALLHGRSYMVGLPDNVVPVPTVSCP